MQHDIPAVVLDLSATGNGIVRSLAKKGIRVYAFDTKGNIRKEPKTIAYNILTVTVREGS
jgi:UDP-N-acetylmuramoylalanine-D-glutamate ligase